MIRLKINNYKDRRRLVSILADAGYAVSIQEESYLATSTYYVIIHEEVNGDAAERDSPSVSKALQSFVKRY